MPCAFELVDLGDLDSVGSDRETNSPKKNPSFLPEYPAHAT